MTTYTITGLKSCVQANLDWGKYIGTNVRRVGSSERGYKLKLEDGKRIEAVLFDYKLVQ